MVETELDILKRLYRLTETEFEDAVRSGSFGFLSRMIFPELGPRRLVSWMRSAADADTLGSWIDAWRDMDTDTPQG